MVNNQPLVTGIAVPILKKIKILLNVCYITLWESSYSLKHAGFYGLNVSPLKFMC